MIRNARFDDIPAIVGLLQDAYRRSHYAREGRVSVDEGFAKQLLVNAIQAGGRKQAPCFVQVSVDGLDLVQGVVVGTLERVYAIGDKLMVTDLFWVASPNVDPRDPERMMRNLLKWGFAQEHVIEAKIGVTAVIGAPEKAGRILKRIGLKEYGRIFRMEAPT